MAQHSARSGPLLGILYEHPDWFRPLFAQLDQRGIAWEPLPVRDQILDPSQSQPKHTLLLNRMSPSAFLRGGASAIHFTGPYLRSVEAAGTRVINGSTAWATEISKAAQLVLLQRLGLPFPRTRIIHHPLQAPQAADGLRFPVVVKPNVGGSGAGVIRFDTREALAEAAHTGGLDLGQDHTALVQEFIPARDGRIVRVEVLNQAFLYGIRIYTSGDQFNLCPADVCQAVDGARLERSACPVDAPENDLQVEGFTPPDDIRSEVEALMKAAGIELGGVEYLVDDRDGQRYYYDVNALSNFVADGPRVVGFDPFTRLADWLEVELERGGA